MRRGNRVVFIVGKLRTTDDMSPHSSYYITSLDIDYLCRYWGMKPAVASEVAIVHVLDRVVRVGRADTNQFALIL